ncbi:MAG: FtsX-like permease family protein [Verrucomicrobiae bacterium]|nr:FtsX-like permease family protein [Verrucomicrobiae bacterium]
MTIGGFILHNAFRNKRRALLCVLSVAASLFLLVMLLVTLRELTVPPEEVESALRIGVRNKISIANFLPARQKPIIQRIPGVVAVTPFTWFGGKYKNEENLSFAQFAMDALTLRQTWAELNLSDDEYKTWLSDMRSCIVGKITAEKYNIKVGDKMLLTSTVYPIDIELKVAGIYSGTIDDRNVLFHHKYLDEMLGNPGTVGMWWVKVRSIDDMPRVIETINKTFANTSAEVRAETERAFQLSFVSMWGNIKMLIHSICSVVIFTLILVSASTMSMAIRERFRELAVLKALGFKRRELFALIFAESFGLAMAGAVLGIGGAWLVFSHTEIMKYATHGIFITFEVTPRIVAQSMFVAVMLGVVSAIAPAIAVAKMSVVEGIKSLD